MTYDLWATKPVPEKPRRPGWLIPAAVLATLIVIGAAVFGVVAYLDSGSINAHGNVVLGFLQFSGTTDCEGDGVYSDIREGTQVTAIGSDGTIFAVATLPAGLELNDHDCEFPFSMKVPAGKGSYGFALAHHGVAVFTEQDVRSGHLALTVA